MHSALYVATAVLASLLMGDRTRVTKYLANRASTKSCALSPVTRRFNRVNDEPTIEHMHAFDVETLPKNAHVGYL
ncbi:Protein of unknown function [Pyronema omphalodes CBS 100304]|uniref:Uncharacterized protein n=1 Tax=Pyronema omphalodes (strain CBS 100304) TaxID=1076935 RepID=U4L661_PYROM|nr:Protein of unknown function [Pyronema omphalodes CBS 100304]